MIKLIENTTLLSREAEGLALWRPATAEQSEMVLIPARWGPWEMRATVVRTDKVRTFAQTCVLFLLSGGKRFDSTTQCGQMVRHEERSGPGGRWCVAYNRKRRNFWNNRIFRGGEIDAHPLAQSTRGTVNRWNRCRGEWLDEAYTERTTRGPQKRFDGISTL